jgi:acyl-CoA synthetase (NDP forming)
MIGRGTELIVGAVHDPQCGPLVMLGAGGVLTDVLGDRSFGLAPLTEHDAEQLLGRLRSARLLDGFRGAPVVPLSAVVDVLVRVAALVDDVPEIAELDLNPLICGTDGLSAVDARIRIATPPRHPDPLVRQLRGRPGD